MPSTSQILSPEFIVGVLDRFDVPWQTEWEPPTTAKFITFMQEHQANFASLTTRPLVIACRTVLVTFSTVVDGMRRELYINMQKGVVPTDEMATSWGGLWAIMRRGEEPFETVGKLLVSMEFEPGFAHFRYRGEADVIDIPSREWKGISERHHHVRFEYIVPEALYHPDGYFITFQGIETLLSWRDSPR